MLTDGIQRWDVLNQYKQAITLKFLDVWLGSTPVLYRNLIKASRVGQISAYYVEKNYMLSLERQGSRPC